MGPEAELEQTEAGLVPASVGWFVMNACDARWFHRPGPWWRRKVRRHARNLPRWKLHPD